MRRRFYTVGLLDPRPQGEEGNEALLGAKTMGLEVTIPALAARCGRGNVDPQHLGGDSTTTAIEVALSMKLPRSRTVFVTIRADADSVGAMAVLTIRGL